MSKSSTTSHTTAFTNHIAEVLWQELHQMIPVLIYRVCLIQELHKL